MGGILMSSTKLTWREQNKFMQQILERSYGSGKKLKSSIKFIDGRKFVDGRKFIGLNYYEEK
jgi:hypothetical protein